MFQPTLPFVNSSIERYTLDIKRKSDLAAGFFIWSFFIGGLLLAFFYDTWLVAAGIGGMSLLAFYGTKMLLPESKLYQYVLAVVLAVFMAQYIYQMHGMFEMHFVAFIASAMLITYQEWKLQIPLAITVIIHHAVFGFMQYSGVDGVYFTELNFMSVETFAIHIILAAAVFGISGLWSYQFKWYGEAHIKHSYEIGKLGEERNQALALATVNQKLRDAQSIAKLGHWSWNLKTNDMETSDELHHIFETNRNEMTADKWRMFKDIDPADMLQMRNLTHQCIANHTQVAHEFSFTTASGINKIIRVQIIPIVQYNETIELQGITQDVTEQRNAERKLNVAHEELNRMYGQLEIKVQQRTAELETANKDLESFSYSVSHDLRAPLRIIHGYSSILHRRLNDKLNENDKELWQEMMGNVKQMNQLIDDLLHFSRLGRAALQTREADMRSIVNTAIEEVKNGSGDFNFEILFNEPQYTNCDSSLMKQVWVNLLSNAVKYSSKTANPKIEIGSTSENNVITYYVKDNGAGFDMKYADKLFGVFQRLHKASEYEGTGVGLALTDRIVRKHGGKIWADAKVDEGATFFFNIAN